MDRPTLALLAWTLALAGACATTEPTPPPPEPADPAPTIVAPEAAEQPTPTPRPPLAVWDAGVGRRGTSNDGAWRIQYRTVPETIPLNDEFGLDAAVFDREGTLVTDVDLAVDAAMPHHRHGMLQAPTIEARDDGTFHVEGLLFHMPGYWELYFDVTDDGITERTQFVVELD